MYAILYLYEKYDTRVEDKSWNYFNVSYVHI